MLGHLHSNLMIYMYTVNIHAFPKLNARNIYKTKQQNTFHLHFPFNQPKASVKRYCNLEGNPPVSSDSSACSAPYTCFLKKQVPSISQK